MEYTSSRPCTPTQCTNSSPARLRSTCEVFHRLENSPNTRARPASSNSGRSSMRKSNPSRTNEVAEETSSVCSRRKNVAGQNGAYQVGMKPVEWCMRERRSSGGRCGLSFEKSVRRSCMPSRQASVYLFMYPTVPTKHLAAIHAFTLGALQCDIAHKK